MIKFFRTIRKELMDTGRTGKYFKYAMGEILLVVIGILIALQINNWNENRRLGKIEEKSISALLNEFKSNKTILEECKLSIDNMRLHADSIRMHIGPEKSAVEIEKVNLWFAKIGNTKRCKITTDVLKDILNSGNLNIISNEEIRRGISKWSSDLKELEREEIEWSQDFNTTFAPYLNKWIQWDDVDYALKREDSRYFRSRFSIDPREVFQQKEFSNIMNNHYWRIMRTEKRTLSVHQQTEEVIGLMQLELNKN